MTMSRWQSVYNTDEMVKRYDTRLKIVGIHVDERDKTVLDMIPFTESDSFRLLDLGAGMGRFTEKIMKKFPEASIVCLDGSAKMLDVARANLGGNEKITFVHQNFDESSWVQSLSGKFDVIVSTGAIHHILDHRRKPLFKEIFQLMDDGGYFINGDLLKSKYDVLTKKYYDDVWARYIQRKTKEVLNVERSIEDVRERMYDALDKEGDNPSTIEEQLRYLHEAGFSVADCVWQYYLLAVIVGIK
jgi:tRNA (cmo5U34)-methyltransferase